RISAGRSSRGGRVAGRRRDRPGLGPGGDGGGDRRRPGTHPRGRPGGTGRSTTRLPPPAPGARGPTADPRTGETRPDVGTTDRPGAPEFGRRPAGAELVNARVLG